MDWCSPINIYCMCCTRWTNQICWHLAAGLCVRLNNYILFVLWSNMKRSWEGSRQLTISCPLPSRPGGSQSAAPLKHCSMLGTWDLSPILLGQARAIRKSKHKLTLLMAIRATATGSHLDKISTGLSPPMILNHLLHLQKSQSNFQWLWC